jgi:ATP-dependent Clp protease adaptor protein ClpS
MSPKKAPGGPRPDEQGDVAVETKPKHKTQKPKLYKVILHNDDYTPMEFVVAILATVFHKSESDAMSIMLHAHTKGFAVAGVFTFEIAEEKVAKVTALAEEAQFPLLCTLEPEEL